ncbi:MAG: two-component system, OmpR family, sensor histidine kinase MprB [Gaiellaceae bacterium]|nr:two-component system, OmpR family, sensor histidine kinase MprB [Gaiellaceae bacterium]
MTFRLRLAIAAALAVALTVAVASAIVYVVMRDQLQKSADQQLLQQYEQVSHDGHLLERAFRDPGPLGEPRRGPSPTALYMQAVRDDGRTQLTSNESAKVPVNDATLAVAAGKRETQFTTATVDGKPSRIYTVYLGQFKQSDGHSHGVALQFVRPIGDISHTLNRLRLILLLVAAGGIAAGAAGGALVSSAALVPVRRLTGAAERIAQTGDPSERVPEKQGPVDDLSRLGTAFNTMLAALEESIETQRRFVADASHELRTPLTSLQTNIEVIKDAERLTPDQRARLFDDLEREAHEMRDLITSLLELARGDANVEHTTVQLDEIVDNAVERARSRFGNVHFNAHIEPTTIEGIPARLERAVWNLIENAGKWTSAGSSVDVTLSGGELRVRDHGPGIAAEDKPHVFDRFYRATTARSQPGSGLGLAIVQDVADEHGGTVSAEDAPGGGALLRLRLTTS